MERLRIGQPVCRNEAAAGLVVGGGGRHHQALRLEQRPRAGHVQCRRYQQNMPDAAAAQYLGREAGILAGVAATLLQHHGLCGHAPFEQQLAHGLGLGRGADCPVAATAQHQQRRLARTKQPGPMREPVGGLLQIGGLALVPRRKHPAAQHHNGLRPGHGVHRQQRVLRLDGRAQGMAGHRQRPDTQPGQGQHAHKRRQPPAAPGGQQHRQKP